MKFRDGMWLVAEGVHVKYAEEVYEIAPRENGLSLLCPTKKVMSRDDTLNNATVRLDIEAAFDGVLSVEATHWDGALERGPHFELYPDGRPPVEAKVESSDKGTTLTSGALAATIRPGDNAFDIRFHSADGSDKQLTSLLGRSVGFAYTPAPSNPLQLADQRDFRHYMFAQTTLGVGESVHGLGERFGAFNRVGQHVSLWNADGGTSSDQAYKNVSFWLSSRGYGVFVDTPARVDLEIGSAAASRLQTSVEAQRLKWYIIYGPTPKEVLTRYCVLTGRPAAVPSWSFGLWLSTSFTTSYDEHTVRSFLEGMRARGTQVDVFHYDCFWMKAFTWTDFVFDAARFPDPKGQIARLKASGLCNKVCVWINPYIAQHGAAFRTAAEKGYLLRRRNGDVWQWDLWQAGMGLVDLTNPAAAAWYADCLGRLLDQGVDALKTDFGERVPTGDVAWHDAAVDPAKMHNYYAFLYNKLVYGVLSARFGPGKAVLFARAACAGTQRFPLQWGGDCESTPEAMAESVRGGLSLGLAGYAFWSVDIGGFEGRPAPWLYKRWVAFGLLCSHSRLHGSGSYRVPWTIDDDAAGEQSCSATLARWAAMKARLMPYLLAQAGRAVKAGHPLSLRAMLLEFPEDPTSWFLDRQFMVGDALLVAPVFEDDEDKGREGGEGGEVQFYLPRGTWTCFFTNRTRVGPGWFRERHRGFGTLPLYVRENTVLVLGPKGEKRDGGGGGVVYDYAADVEVCLYQVGGGGGGGGASADVVDGDGAVVGTLTVGKDGELGGTEVLKGKWTKTSGGRKLGEGEEGLEGMIEWL